MNSMTRRTRPAWLTGVTAIIALTLVLWTAVSANGQRAPNVHFRHLSVEDGLSQESVHAVLQDSQGLLWFGTQDGLNRYDGYDFTVFNHDPRDPTSLATGPPQLLGLRHTKHDLLWGHVQHLEILGKRHGTVVGAGNAVEERVASNKTATSACIGFHNL